MTMAPFNEGDLVRLVATKEQYDGGWWRDEALIVQEKPPWAQPEYEYLLNSADTDSMVGAIKCEWLAPILREGDVVTAADGKPSGELGTVVKVSRKGRWATIQYDHGGAEKWYTPELRLLRRRTEADEVIADLRTKVEELEVAAAQLERAQRAAQYRSDAALLRAGLVRVELLAHWRAELHERTPRDGSLGLLTELRATIKKAEENL